VDRVDAAIAGTLGADVDAAAVDDAQSPATSLSLAPVGFVEGAAGDLSVRHDVERPWQTSWIDAMHAPMQRSNLAAVAQSRTRIRRVCRTVTAVVVARQIADSSSGFRLPIINIGIVQYWHMIRSTDNS
jgi:hypothetical protein